MIFDMTSLRFYPLDAVLARYLSASSVRPSVCHKSGVLLRRLNLGWRKERCTIAQGL